ncbi:MAG: hypothetical protein JWN99_1376 [Ilumatobacteraceae bacterium]|nr:hypothetical protein [Ilumatobacteraceae bacterium]
MSSADVHVVPLERGWEVRRAGERYPASRHSTRWSAIKTARAMAAESRTEVVIHRLDGTISVEAAADRPGAPELA